ncbi:MAG: DUF2089 domain-containing protein [Sphaerobacter sp.]|nr:DUF2089 domain-containing protein [Sphaerobacter sp.]
MFTAPQQCPTCGSPLQLRELACPACATTVRGTWAASPFSRLTADQQTFLLLFVRSRGNLSDVERTLGISYPTVRAKLEEIIAALADPAPPESAPAAPASPRQELLERIARGELTVDEGLAQLRRLPLARDGS